MKTQEKEPPITCWIPCSLLAHFLQHGTSAWKQSPRLNQIADTPALAKRPAHVTEKLKPVSRIMTKLNATNQYKNPWSDNNWTTTHASFFLVVIFTNWFFFRQGKHERNERKSAQMLS